MNKRLVGLLALFGLIVVSAAVLFFFTDYLKDIFGAGPKKHSETTVERPLAAKRDGRPLAVDGEKRKAASELEVPKATPSHRYAAQDRRDPFVPLVAKYEPERMKGAAPLQNYEIAEMRLIAVLWSKKGYYALIVLPDGKSYTIQEGTKIGFHDGTVRKISKDSVAVRETVRNNRGVLSPRDTILKLRVEEQG